MVRVKRAYEEPSREDGTRILVDRLWPRGLAKEKAKIDLWLREIAPSDALRKWFGHDPSRWSEFKRRYFRELKERDAELAQIRTSARHGDLTLLFGSKEQEYNNAVALREYLTGHRR